MNKLALFFIALLFASCTSINAQTIYVDAINGKEDGKGTIAEPFSGLEKAIATANGFTGDEPIVVKMTPGLYVISHQLIIKTSKMADDTLKFTIEATIMPDDADWQPAKMPVIQSVSPNNSVVQFRHSVGFLVAKSNVAFKGLKFVGNANPDVPYYYPITRENENLNKLEVSQCYFIGEKNSTRLQSGIWAHGAGIHVDHCVFYGCRNAMVLIKSIKDFSLTNSIIYGAYESGIWYGASDAPFIFRNNIVTHCNFVWVRPRNTQPAYTFSNSIISDNDHYMGYIANELIPAPENNLTEMGLWKSAKIHLIEIKTEAQQPHDYLNLSPESDGRDLLAGIF
jgi:hypothetical protein